MGWFAMTRAAAKRFGHRCRARRYERFTELCRLEPTDTIVDIGAGGGESLAAFNPVNRIFAVDRNPTWEQPDRPNVCRVTSDARSLPFETETFDIAFSNSVIEHVPPEDHERFANELRRVTRGRYYVQTPNKWFPIEPHYQLPLFQFLPTGVKFALNRRFKIGWQPKGCCETITLLSARDLHRLFPDAEIHRERLFGLTKSLMAVRR